MTGLWQISGRSDLSFDDLVRLDFYYLENWSIWLDISILAKTLPAVLAEPRAPTERIDRYLGRGVRRRSPRATSAAGPAYPAELVVVGGRAARDRTGDDRGRRRAREPAS